MNTPKTIKIFLTEGDSTGLKTAELSNWTGQAIVIPRNKMKDAKLRKECCKPGIYFLIGKDEEDLNVPKVYIGEAEVIWQRLFEHDNKKDFWQWAICFTSKDENLTKAHVRYLESICISQAKLVGRSKLQNDKESAKPSLPESDIAEMNEYLDNLNILLSTLGYPILKEIITKSDTGSSDPLFYCKGKGVEAIGRMTSDGFVVYKGSTASNEYSKAVEKSNQKIIDYLIQDGYIDLTSNKDFIFKKDFLFNSPSGASDIILGNSTNGWERWKNKEGKTLDELYRNNKQAKPELNC